MGYQLDETYLDEDDVLRGNCTVQVGPYAASFTGTDIGAIISASITPNLSTTEEQTDNSPGTQRIFKHTHNVQLTQIEWLNSAVSDILLGDTETMTAVTGVEVAAEEQIISAGWVENRVYALNGVMATGAIPTTITATAETSGLGIVDDDYFVVEIGGGKWGILFRTGGTKTFATTEVITLAVTYTPAAGYYVIGGISKEVSKFSMRLTFLNNGGSTVVYDYYKCQIENTDAISLPADDAEESRVLRPLNIVCLPDELYQAGAVYKRTVTY